MRGVESGELLYNRTGMDQDTATSVFETELKGDFKTPPADEDPFRGKQYGQWKLAQRIGMGGVGLVYLAKNTQDGKTAAVKLLRDSYSQHPEGRARFKREGELTTKRLQHRNVLKGLLFGEQAGLPYFVAEYIEGETLEDMIVREKLTPEKMAGVMDEVLQGLEHTHQCGIVHRDIKPANIMIDKKGRVIVIDYGLAKDDQVKVAITRSGAVMGSPSFMSPEQAAGERGTTSSDLYACGILMFVMLTGRRPFNADTPTQIARKQIEDKPPSVRLLKPATPPSIDRIITKLLEKDPKNRYATAGEVRKALKEAIPQSASSGTSKLGSRPTSPPGARSDIASPSPTPGTRFSSSTPMSQTPGAPYLPSPTPRSATPAPARPPSGVIPPLPPLTRPPSSVLPPLPPVSKPATSIRPLPGAGPAPTVAAAPESRSPSLGIWIGIAVAVIAVVGGLLFWLLRH